MTPIDVGLCSTNSNGMMAMSPDPVWNALINLGFMAGGAFVIVLLLGYLILDIPMRRKLTLVMPLAEKGIPFISYIARLYNYVGGILLENYRAKQPKWRRWKPHRQLEHNDMIYGREVNMRALANRFQIGYSWVFVTLIPLTLIFALTLGIHDQLIYKNYAKFRDKANEKISYWQDHPDTPRPEFRWLPKECR